MKLLKTIFTFFIVSVTLLCISFIIIFLYWLSLFYVVPKTSEVFDLQPLAELNLRKLDDYVDVEFCNPSPKFNAFNLFFDRRNYDDYKIDVFDFHRCKHIRAQKIVTVKTVCIEFNRQWVATLGFDRICKVVSVQNDINDKDILINRSGFDVITKFIANNYDDLKFVDNVSGHHKNVNVYNISQCFININNNGEIILPKKCDYDIN